MLASGDAPVIPVIPSGVSTDGTNSGHRNTALPPAAAA